MPEFHKGNKLLGVEDFVFSMWYEKKARKVLTYYHSFTTTLLIQYHFVLEYHKWREKDISVIFDGSSVEIEVQGYGLVMC